jgi:hypothetical protein
LLHFHWLTHFYGQLLLARLHLTGTLSLAHFTESQRSHWLTLFATLSLAHRPSLAEPSLAYVYSHCTLPVT